MLSAYTRSDTICAIATPEGPGALAIVRLSGSKAIAIADAVFTRNLVEMPANSASYGWIRKGAEVVDEAIAVLFRGPQSFTGEDTVEFTLHGSPYVRQRVLELLVDAGANIAQPGEFTMRAFLNGKMDLSQAEAIGDLISSESAAAHQLAIKQLRGGFSRELSDLREKLVEFAALVELELDFVEEDVEFANRGELRDLVSHIHERISRLAGSFKLGNAIRKGIPVAIAGAPNAGKSTLLNALLNDDKAIVSEIAGTTRDAIEDRISVQGIEFRFIDTAGLRETTDVVEKIGIERSYQKVDEAVIVLLLFDMESEPLDDVLATARKLSTGKHLILVGNKSDRISTVPAIADFPFIAISARDGQGVETLSQVLVDYVRQQGYTGNEVLVTNTRHFEALSRANEALQRVLQGLDNNLSGDLVAMDIRQALHYMGEVTGQVSNDELLGFIFGRFCIGK
jgi:tRNA modification GTPase